jgi:hypothetical protein
MARFIHLTDERLLAKLKKAGITMTRWGAKIRCVYAMPVLPDFEVSHQWLRESSEPTPTSGTSAAEQPRVPAASWLTCNVSRRK